MPNNTNKRDKKEIKAEIKALKKEKRSVKKEKDPIYLEARKVLLNQVELDKDGRFITTTEARFPLWGAADGENRIRVFGVSNRTFVYDADVDNKKAVFKAGKAMANIGRGINLRSNKNAAACLVKTYIFYPTVLIFYEDEDGGLLLRAFTPRTYTSGLAIKLAVKKFEKSIGDEIERLGKDSGPLSGIKDAYYRHKFKKEVSEDDDDYEIELEEAEEETDEDEFIEDDFELDEPEDDGEDEDEADEESEDDSDDESEDDDEDEFIEDDFVVDEEDDDESDDEYDSEDEDDSDD